MTQITTFITVEFFVLIYRLTVWGLEPDPAIQWRLQSDISVLVPHRLPAAVIGEKGKAENLYVEERWSSGQFTESI